MRKDEAVRDRVRVPIRTGDPRLRQHRIGHTLDVCRSSLAVQALVATDRALFPVSYFAEYLDAELTGKCRTRQIPLSSGDGGDDSLGHRHGS